MLKKIIFLSTFCLTFLSFAEPPETLTVKQARSLVNRQMGLIDPGTKWQLVGVITNTNAPGSRNGLWTFNSRAVLAMLNQQDTRIIQDYRGFADKGKYRIIGYKVFQQSNPREFFHIYFKTLNRP